MDDRGSSMDFSLVMIRPHAINVKLNGDVFHPDPSNDEPEPLSPESIFHVEHKYHDILLKFVFEDRVEASELRDLARDTICHHPRFHSRVKHMAGNAALVWESVPVDLTWHIVDEGEVEEDEAESSRKECGYSNGVLSVVEKFAVHIHASPRFDFSRPLWQMHLLHVNRAASTAGTPPAPSTAPAVPSAYSILIFRVNHAVGDLSSLMALVNDCATHTPPPPPHPPHSPCPSPIPSSTSPFPPSSLPPQPSQSPSPCAPPPSSASATQTTALLTVGGCTEGGTDTAASPLSSELMTTFSSPSSFDSLLLTPSRSPSPTASALSYLPPQPHPSLWSSMGSTALALWYTLWVFWVFACKEIRAIVTLSAGTAADSAAGGKAESATAAVTATTGVPAGRAGERMGASTISDDPQVATADAEARSSQEYVAVSKAPVGGDSATWQRATPTAGVLWNSIRGGLEFVHAVVVPDSSTCIRNEGVMQDWGRWSIGGEVMESTFGCMEPIDMVRLNRVRKSLGATVNDVLVAVIAGGLDRYLLSKREFGGGSSSSSKDGEVGGLTAAMNREKEQKERQLKLHACSFVNLRGAALARQSSADWWMKYRGVGSSLKGPWGNVLGVHTVSLPLWGPKAAHCNYFGRKEQQQYCRGGQGSYSETERVIRLKSQFDRKKRSYEAQVVRIQWDRQAVGAQAFVVSHLCHNATVGVSNIEGPRQPITLAGHRVREMCVSSFGLPLGINFQIYSYAGFACISATSLKAFLPDPLKLCAYINEAFAALESENSSSLQGVAAK